MHRSPTIRWPWGGARRAPMDAAGQLGSRSRSRVDLEPPAASFGLLTWCSHKATVQRDVEVRRTERFARWLDALRDVRGRARIQARIERLAAGNPGDVAPVGEGVSELRIDVGPGHRVYFTRRGRAVIILLAGGSKHTQTTDIRAALQLARGLAE